MSKTILLPYCTPAVMPNELPGLLFWYDFDDISTLYQGAALTTPVTTNGQNITSVTDKSGNGYHLDVVTGGNVPPTYNASGQNGRGTALFDHPTAGAVQELRTLNLSGTTSPFTYFIASTTPANTPTRSYLVDAHACSGTNRFAFYTNSGSVVRVLNETFLNTTIPYSTFLAVTVESGATTNVWNGTSLDTSGSMGTNGFDSHVIGRQCNGGQQNTGLPHNVGEVFVYSTQPGPADVAKLQNYLLGKWRP